MKDKDAETVVKQFHNGTILRLNSSADCVDVCECAFVCVCALYGYMWSHLLASCVKCIVREWIHWW